ncbi:hypothetical protein [Frigoribacterium sp. PhB24]|uniref:hypothetical protein n=1 Tax=Frigoribacterium sp. PhB24 TaxID=2485204 RepID=UPI000F4781BB|nr:hypothetical protein [Frigoribacterium sp. PhB24]ROS51469.1 hypothetical protein EDF50_1782 [Frigoribacterium sp. PhB24]
MFDTILVVVQTILTAVGVVFAATGPLRRATNVRSPSQRPAGDHGASRAVAFVSRGPRRVSGATIVGLSHRMVLVGTSSVFLLVAVSVFLQFAQVYLSDQTPSPAEWVRTAGVCGAGAGLIALAALGGPAGMKCLHLVLLASPVLGAVQSIFRHHGALLETPTLAYMTPVALLVALGRFRPGWLGSCVATCAFAILTLFPDDHLVTLGNVAVTFVAGFLWQVCRRDKPYRTIVIALAYVVTLSLLVTSSYRFGTLVGFFTPGRFGDLSERWELRGWQRVWLQAPAFGSSGQESFSAVIAPAAEGWVVAVAALSGVSVAVFLVAVAALASWVFVRMGWRTRDDDPRLLASSMLWIILLAANVLILLGAFPTMRLAAPPFGAGGYFLFSTGLVALTVSYARGARTPR